MEVEQNEEHLNNTGDASAIKGEERSLGKQNGILANSVSAEEGNTENSCFDNQNIVKSKIDATVKVENSLKSGLTNDYKEVNNTCVNADEESRNSREDNEEDSDVLIITEENFDNPVIGVNECIDDTVELVQLSETQQQSVTEELPETQQSSVTKELLVTQQSSVTKVPSMNRTSYMSMNAAWRTYTKVQVPIKKNVTNNPNQPTLKKKKKGKKKRLRQMANNTPQSLLNAQLPNNSLNKNIPNTNKQTSNMVRPNVSGLKSNSIKQGACPTIESGDPVQQSRTYASAELDESEFSKAERTNPMLVAIVQEDYPDVEPLTFEHLNIIHDLIKIEIDQIQQDALSPRFVHSYLKSGIILVTCHDMPSKEWLKAIVPKLSIYTDESDVRFKALSINELNTLFNASIIVSPAEDSVTILNRIQKQNPDVNMASWLLYSETRLKGSPSSIILKLGIPESSIRILRQRDFSVFHGMGQVRVEMEG